MPGILGTSRWTRPAIVAAGYLSSMAVAVVAVVLYDNSFSAADQQAMGGMIAGGGMMLGGAVFFLLSLVPTSVALWFLRENRLAWSVFTLAALAVAVVGLFAVFLPLAPRAWLATVPALDLLGMLSPLWMLSTPLWIGGFLLFAVLAPATDLRRRLLVATAIEVAIAGCGLVHFLVPRPPI